MNFIYAVLIGILIMVSALITFALVWYKWKNRKLLSVARKLPSTEMTMSWWRYIYYSFYDIHELTASVIIDMSTNAASKGLDEYCFWVGPMPYILTQKPEDIQILLNNSRTMGRGSVYEVFKDFFGYGLLTAPVHIWKVTRRCIQPLFNSRSIELMIPTFNSNGHKLVENFSEHVGRDYVDILPVIYPNMIMSMSSLITGPKWEYYQKPDVVKKLQEVILKGARLTSARFILIWLRWKWLFKFLCKNDISKIESISALLMEPIHKVLKEEVNSLETPASYPGEEEAPTLVDAFVDLLRSNPDFSEQSLQDEIFTFVSVGSDTSAVTLATCLLALAAYPDIQEAIVQQITALMGDSSKDPTLEEINMMTYLEQFLKETLRRFTVVPVVQRRTTGDLNLSFGILPAGTDIGINLYGLHMNPKLYPEPKKFDPDRFSRQNAANRHRCSYVPFTEGPRVCIGETFAKINIKILLVHIVRRYRLSTKADVNDVKYRFMIEFSRKNGYPIHIKNRT